MGLFPCHRSQEKGQKGKEAEGEKEGVYMVLSLKLSWSQEMMGKYKVSLGNTRFPFFLHSCLESLMVADGLRGKEQTRSFPEACEKWA